MLTSLLSASLVTSRVTLTELLLGVVSMVALVTWAVSKSRGPRLPPGPRGLPFVGNMLDLRGPGTLADKFIKLGKEYGPVMTVKLGMKPVVVLQSPEALHEAYVTRGDDLADKPRALSLDIASNNGSDIAFAGVSPALKYRRKVAMKALRQYLTGDQHTERLHRVVSDTVDGILKETEPFCMGNHTYFCIFNVLHGLCFGSTLRSDNKDFQRMRQFMMSEAGDIGSFLEDFCPPLRHIWQTSAFKKFCAGNRFFIDYINAHIKDILENWDGETLTNLTQNIFHAKQQNEEGDSEELMACLTEKHASSLMLDVFFAGIDTTRTTLEWLFLHLAIHPDVQARCQAEIDATCGTAIPARHHRQGLTYTEAVIMEVMRLFPSVPTGLPHQAYRDTHVQGFHIPRGTMVMANLKAVMHHPDHWEAAREFRPERFIKKQEENHDDASSTCPNGKKEPRSKLKTFVPFNIGSRNCVGEFLARQNLLYITVGLLQRLTFALPQGHSSDLSPPDSWMFGPCRPYEVVATPRTAMAS